MVKSPILWSIFAGFFFRFLRIPVPETILTTFDFGGNAAPPMAALVLGISLGETSFHFNRHLFAALVLRFAGGFLLGLAGSVIFGLEGLSRTVVIVASSLPSAVFTSVLPVRYGVKADFGGTMVVVSTLLGIISIPVTFWLAG
jgi:predicted permease